MDSCSLTPSSKNETLPSGCTLNGTNTTTVDVGECKPVTCVMRNSSFNASCTDPSLCCGPRSFATVLVQCGALMSFDLSIVKTCGCGKCMEKQTTIKGYAVGQDESAARIVDLFFAGKMVARTDANGRFSFDVPKTTKRAIVTFKDLIIKKFEEEDKIFILNEGQTAVYKVKLREKPKPITFNASEPLDVPLGGESDSFADLELPENALLTEDGSVFSGNAKATVSVTDPRNQSDILSAPGDFSTTSEDGEEEILETYGMMKLNLEDEDGKPLVMSKPMKVYLDPEKLNLTVSDGNVSVKLYWLDRKTGRWREVGDFVLEDGSKRRRKRANRVFLAGTVTPSIAKENLNFDWPERRVGLRVTIKATENDARNDVIITAIRQDHKGYTERTTVNGVVCMPIWNDKKYYLQAQKNFKYYDPDPDLKDFKTTFKHVQGGVKPIKDNNGKTISSFEFNGRLVNKRGPIYFDDGEGGTERKMCEQSLNAAQSQPKGSQFVFIPPSDDKKEYQLLSYTDQVDWLSAKKFETCFIKVKVTTKNALFMAASYGQRDHTHTGKKGFHVRMSKTSTVSAEPGNAVCLQFRCPKENDYTVVLLTPMNSATADACSFQGLDFDGALNPVQNRCGSLPLVKGEEKWLCIPFDKSHGSRYSTYKGLGKVGEARCLLDDHEDDSEDTSVVNPAGYSLTYDCRYVQHPLIAYTTTVIWVSSISKISG